MSKWQIFYCCVNHQDHNRSDFSWIKKKHEKLTKQNAQCLSWASLQSPSFFVYLCPSELQFRTVYAIKCWTLTRHNRIHLPMSLTVKERFVSSVLSFLQQMIKGFVKYYIVRDTIPFPPCFSWQYRLNKIWNWVQGWKNSIWYYITTKYFCY